jgi:hypothetical protein
MSFFAIGGTNVVFLAIGRTNVDLIEGGTNVVVAVALQSSGTYDGGKKVAASLGIGWLLLDCLLIFYKKIMTSLVK